MDVAAYDRWYDSPRGRWIAEQEIALILGGLDPQPGESLLDIGCGTGYFTRALARHADGRVDGIDIDPVAVDYARRRGPDRIGYTVADALALPYPDASFDLVMSITALCFVRDELQAVRELVRVARRRFALGLLNRHSLLWMREGRTGGHGGYRGAHWHSVAEARRLLAGLPVADIQVRTAIHLPGGGQGARIAERFWPARAPTGAFILVSGQIAR